MAVTCMWEYELGRGKQKLKTPKETIVYDVSFYGGGNCLFVACYKDTKNLYTFATDVKHAKAFLTKEQLGLSDIVIFIEKNKKVNQQCKALAKLFVELSIPFNLIEKQLGD